MASAADGDRRGTPEPGRRRGGARGCRGVRPCAGRAVAVVQRARTGGRVLPAARAGDLRVGLPRRAASDTAPENVARRSALTEPGPDVTSSDPMPVPTTGGAVRDEAGFRAFVETNGATLLHAARLLTGDHHRGEDLVQTALTKVYLKWGSIGSRGRCGGLPPGGGASPPPCRSPAGPWSTPTSTRPPAVGGARSRP